MSSKLLDPDDGREVQTMTWRAVGSNGNPEGFANAGAVETGRQMEQRLREAHAAGVREGEAAGQRRAAAELQSAIERLCRSIEEIGGLRARLRREAEQDLVRLALGIARRILRRELAVDPGAIHDLILGALERLAGQEISCVRVHPAQEAAVAACLRDRKTGAAVEVKPDAGCAPGAVIFETARGRLDASVDAQLEEIERGLTDRLERHS